MKLWVKKLLLILLAIFFLCCFGVWLIACLFATGQLYNSYELWKYLVDAPVAVLILVGLLAAAIASLVAAIRVKDKSSKEETKIE